MHPYDFQKQIEDNVLAEHDIRLKVADLSTPLVVAGCHFDEQENRITLLTRDGACWHRITFDAAKIERAETADRYHIRDNEGDKMLLTISEVKKWSLDMEQAPGRTGRQLQEIR